MRVVLAVLAVKVSLKNKEEREEKEQKYWNKSLGYNLLGKPEAIVTGERDMPTINVYNQAENRIYTVTVDIYTSVLDRVLGSPSDAEIDYYLRISTTMRKSTTKAALPEFLVRTLNDTPPGYPPASNFTELVDDYMQYYIDQAELGYSSSSSSSESSSSTGSSSSSSSFEYSSSSSSSNSSVSSSSSSSSSHH